MAGADGAGGPALFRNTRLAAAAPAVRRARRAYPPHATLRQLGHIDRVGGGDAGKQPADRCAGRGSGSPRSAGWNRCAGRAVARRHWHSHPGRFGVASVALGAHRARRQDSGCAVHPCRRRRYSAGFSPAIHRTGVSARLRRNHRAAAATAGCRPTAVRSAFARSLDCLHRATRRPHRSGAELLHPLRRRRSASGLWTLRPAGGEHYRAAAPSPFPRRMPGRRRSHGALSRPNQRPDTQRGVSQHRSARPGLADRRELRLGAGGIDHPRRRGGVALAASARRELADDRADRALGIARRRHGAL